MKPNPQNKTNKQTKKRYLNCGIIPPNHIKLYKHCVDKAAESLCSQFKTVGVLEFYIYYIPHHFSFLVSMHHS